MEEKDKKGGERKGSMTYREREKTIVQERVGTAFLFLNTAHQCLY